ncbi:MULTISPECIES: phosphoenolpyruvate--protein phosphotransferase [unclassified Paenibacillus]|uniref:phosphoenolpyruvate--protein phosphotransferase n=1 Tax=unclassified Paenibacillus TaxID=185978 RepID=UPI0009551106|nr:MULTISPECIES: phosphoenolpyruvate--protein phosphotransferase [unclassified Paenibacillus]ASS64739.1 phosphoenolpyruvate--protein phosphotransferase [Paenibacillus sp. RUD330]SIR08335.1 phosphotransferase system, enzyme I, PtsI [Paenibacillus sp. RU4X]SIR27777.1 phosphotransferase system, enzyme I, PtsI [Paenibacillus sp. RU4T]
MSQLITGVAASPGIAIAKAYRLQQSETVPSRKPAEDAGAEKQRLKEAVEAARVDIDRIRERTLDKLGAQKAEIFEAHLFLLDDPDLIDAAMDMIDSDGVDAAYALHEVSSSIIDVLRSMDNELLRERAADVKDVAGRVISKLEGREHSALSELDEETILIANDLTPSDTAQLDLDYVRGFVTEIGSRTSHSAIMARSLELPAVVGAGAAAARIESGSIVILDAVGGEVIVDPSDSQLQDYQARKREYEDYKLRMQQFVNRPSVTSDGHEVELASNIGGVEDLEKVLANGSDGIGLFRTEFLYMGRSTFPSEEEQFTVYKHVLEKMNGKRVVIRTLDIGGDKELPYLTLPKEANPFLGLRAVRLCLERQDLFRAQLRALLRASAHGKLAIMFPMIAVVSELREAKRILAEERASLESEGVPVSNSLEVGIMIEIPAAALNAEALVKEVDFFSIGTNDLIQYTMAADRMNESVAYLYQPHHPSILRLVNMVIQAAKKHGKWAGMCGEMAGDAAAIPLLLGMGLHEFSMSASSVLPARELVSRLSQQEWAVLAEEALGMDSQQEVLDFVNQQLRSEA